MEKQSQVLDYLQSENIELKESIKQLRAETMKLFEEETSKIVENVISILKGEIPRDEENSLP